MKKIYLSIRDFLHSRTLMDFLYIGLFAFILIRIYNYFIYTGVENPALNILFFLPIFAAFAYLIYELILILRRERKNSSPAFILLIALVYLYILYEFLSMAYLVFT